MLSMSPSTPRYIYGDFSELSTSRCTVRPAPLRYYASVYRVAQKVCACLLYLYSGFIQMFQKKIKDFSRTFPGLLLHFSSTFTGPLSDSAEYCYFEMVFKA